MNEMIIVKNCQEIELFLSEFHLLDFFEAKGPHHKTIKAISLALVADILSVRADRKVEVEYFFSNSDFTISFNRSFPHFHKDARFCFKYEYENLQTNMHNILNESLQKSIDNEGAYLGVISIKESQQFFKNLSIFECITGTDGALLNHFKKNPFKLSWSGVKEQFEVFELEKTMNSVPYLALKTGPFKAVVSENYLKFNFKGIEINFEITKMTSDPLTTIQPLIFSIFNSTHECQVKDANEFKMMLGLLSV